MRFSTEILHICSSPKVSTRRIDCEPSQSLALSWMTCSLDDATALLVRLHSSTRLLNLIPNPLFLPPSEACPVKTLEVATLRSTETSGRRHVDVALDPVTWSRALVVDESGGVWLWWEDWSEQHQRLIKTHRL